MAVRPFITAPEDYAPALDIVGEHVTVLASGEATDGYEIFLQRGPEGSGPPPHSHPWDEGGGVKQSKSPAAFGKCPKARNCRRNSGRSKCRFAKSVNLWCSEAAIVGFVFFNAGPTGSHKGGNT
jgi:hypothetical protein